MALVQVVLTWQFSTPCQSSNYQLIDFKFFVGEYVPGYSNPAKFGFGQITRWRLQVVVKYTGPVTFILIFCFSGSRPVETRGPILAHSSLKYAVWCKEVPFGVYHCNFKFFGGVLP